MLKEIFRTVTVPYMLISEYKGGYGFGISYNGNKPPYVESLYYFSGLCVGAYSTRDSPSSIYLFGTMSTNYWPSWDSAFWRFDGKTGKCIKRINQQGNLGSITLGNKHSARSGKMWAKTYWQDGLVRFDLGKTAKSLLGDEPKTEEGYWWAAGSLGANGDEAGSVPVEHFEGGQWPGGDPDSNAPHIGGIGIGGDWAIDDLNNRFLNAQFEELSVYVWSTGKFLYTIRLPEVVVSICLEDSSRAYILMGNQIVVLLDYIRGEVLGSSRVPPVKVGRSYWNNTEVSMAYDETFRRLLVVEHTPDNPDGSSSIYIRGFRQVPEPVRLSTPIPLKAPRQGRVIPVLVQCVGGMNEGVGGYVIDAKVEGAGSLAGLPVSDYRGNARIPVACEGSRLFVPSPADPSSDWETTGSPDATPPHTGLVVVTASARIYAPDPADIPVSGASGEVRGGPGEPGFGGDQTKHYLWTWYDQVAGAPPPQSPNPGGPQSMQAWYDYFWSITGQEIDTPADDFNDVLMGLVNQGCHTNPAQGEKPQADWPFNGLMIMVSGGEARGRIWLPTATTNAASGGWYTHEMQVIKDDPSGGAANETSPNMFYIVQEVKNSRVWQLNDPQQAKFFVEQCVTKMHDVNALFGHLKEDAGGHSAHSLLYKADTTTAEQIQIISDSGAAVWTWIKRSKDLYAKWYYPA
jgi:hypothetical protein